MDTRKPFRKVGTHHGRFHADEVMATAILKEIFEIEVVRTRDSQVLGSLDLVYDVGGGEFDHHGVEKVYRKNGIPYAACGLIWKSFGEEVIRSWDLSLGEEEISRVFEYIDESLIEGIDAVDNGVETGKPEVATMNISSIISGFNPPWNSGIPEERAFNDAVNFAQSIFENTIKHRMAILRVKDKIIEAYNARTVPEIVALNEYCPWGRAIKEIDIKKEVLFVVYPSKEGYSLQTVRKKGGSLEARKDLPKTWAGKRDEELGKIIGINDAIFCHPARFIAGARSLGSIMKMAKIALAEPPDRLIERIVWYLKKLIPGSK